MYFVQPLAERNRHVRRQFGSNFTAAGFPPGWLAGWRRIATRSSGARSDSPDYLSHPDDRGIGRPVARFHHNARPCSNAGCPISDQKSGGTYRAVPTQVSDNGATSRHQRRAYIRAAC